MNARELIEIVRQDYLDDTRAEFGWSNNSLLKKCSEAERQACNRVDLLFDDSTPCITEIKLIDDVSSYQFHEKITVIENFVWNGLPLMKVTKEMLDKENPKWRGHSGIGSIAQPKVLVQGRYVRIYPTPTANDVAIDGVLRLEVWRLPKEDITSEEQCFEIPSEFVPNLKYWVLHECYKKQDLDQFNQEKSDYYLQRFNQAFGLPVTHTVRQHQFHSPRSLTVRPVPYGGRIKTDSGWN